MIKYILRLLSFLGILMCVVNIYAQNADTPNLSFEQGGFNGWSLYTGDYYYNETTGKYVTDWNSVASTDRIKIMNSIGTEDPIVSCSNFLINPDGNLVARIGVPRASEAYDAVPNKNSCTGTGGRLNAKAATAERMTYSFIVTEKTTLFTYKFAAVLHVPTNDAHSGEQLPSFAIDVSVVDPVTNAESVLPCGSFSVSADMSASSLERNKTKRECPSSVAQNEAEEYVFRKWTTGSFNLSDHIGKRVTINIETHDCLVVTCGDNIIAGGHEAYGYFWAETRELKLETKNCGTDDATITAPPGFSSYSWSRSDGKVVELVDITEPSVALIRQSSISAGVVYTCEMKGDMAGCSPIILSTELNTVKMKANFSYENQCSGKVAFTDKSVVEGDTIQSYMWDFGDGSVSLDKNPVHTYAAPGEYSVTLKIISSLGCEIIEKKNILVRYFPDLEIDGKTEVCAGEKVILTVLEAEVGSQFLWNNGSTLQTMIETAETSQEYTVSVIDPYSCSYEKSIYVSVKPIPALLISGDTVICLNDTATLTVKGAQSYIWDNGSTEAQTKVRPLASAVYTVSGTAANGCKNSLNVFVRVNPLPNINIDGVNEICENSSAALSVQGAKTYYWGDMYSGSDRVVYPTLTTTYTVTGTDENGCSSSSFKTVKVKPNPELSYKGDTIVCEGEFARIVVQGAPSYAWHDGSTSGIYNKIPTTDTVYWVDGIMNGCTSRISIPIKVLPLPVIWIDGETELCQKDTLKLKAKGADSYLWSTGSVTDSTEAVPLTSTVYQVKGTGKNGCSGIVPIDVIVHQTPSIIISGDASVCENSLANLTVQGEASVYYWSNGSMGTSIKPLITEKTIFTVEGVDQYGCVGKASYLVNSIAPPKLSYIGDTVVCQGQSLTLVAQGASSYVWHDGTPSGVYTKIPVSDTIYSFTGTLNGCTSKLTVPIRVLSLPFIWTEGKTELCVDDTLVLQAKGGESYSWNTGSVQDIIKDVPRFSTSYQVQGLGSNGCTKTIAVDVTVHQKPVISITGDRNVCENNFTTLTAQGDAVVYVWDNGTIGNAITPLITESKEYSVRGESEHGCVSMASYKVNRIFPPVLSFIGDTTVCQGAAVTLVAQGASSYVWHDGSVSSNYSRIPTMDTVYTVTGTLNGCSSQKNILIQVLPLPFIWAEGKTEICVNDTVRIQVKGADSYRWSTGATSDIITETPLASTLYQVQGTGNNGCTKTISVDAIVHQKPVIKIEGNASVCENDYATLTAKGDAIVYVWDNGTIGNTITPLITETKVYTVKGENEYGCVNTTSHTVNRILPPELSFMGDVSICQGSSVTLVVQGASSYVWQDGSVSSVYSRIPTMDTIYTVTGTLNGCSSKMDIPVQILPLPFIWTEGKKEICVMDTIRLQAKGAETYRWSTGAVTDAIIDIPLVSTSYQVQGTGSNGCVNTISIEAIVHQKPVIKIEGETAVCENDFASLMAQGDAVAYIWNDGTIGALNRSLITEKTKYTVKGTDAFGCVNTLSHTVNSIVRPVLSYQGETEVCLGQSITLSAQGASTYVWQDGTISNIYSRVPVTDTVYTVTGTLNGCSSEMNVPVHVLSLPVIWTEGKKEICINDTIRLQAQGAETYRWSTGVVSESIVDVPLISTTYQVTGIGTNGCFRTISIDAVVHQKPVILIEGENSVCENNFTKLTAQGDAISYVWNDGTPGASIRPLITENITYTVQGTDAFGCVNTASYTIKSVSPPVLSYQGKTEVCQGDVVTVSALGASSFVWHDGSISNAYSKKPTVDTVYSVVGTMDGCSSRLDIPIHVLPLPYLWTEGRTDICLGDTLKLKVKDADSYVWFIWSTGSVSDSLVTVPQASTFYQVQGTDANGCVKTVSVDVLVRPQPIISIEGDIEVCENGVATLTANGEAITYYWSNGNIGQTIRPLVENTTIYSVKGVDKYGCASVISHQVNTVLPPVLSFLGDTAVCLGESVTLTGQGAASYKWSDGTTSSTFKMYPTGSTRVTMTGTLRNCSATITIPIYIKIPPNLYITGDSIVCKNTPFSLTVDGAESYVWSTGDVSKTISYSPLATAPYYVTGIGSNGCKTREKKIITVLPLPKVKLKLDNAYGCPDIRDTMIVSASGAIDYTWGSIPYNPEISDNSSNRLVSGFDEETVVFVEGVDNNGCYASDSILVEKLVYPEMSFQVSPNWVEEGSSTVRFNGMTPVNSVWYWTPGDGTEERKGNNLAYSYSVVAADSFLVTVRSVDQRGCEYRGESWVYAWREFWAPDGFSPNKDGLNDKFHFYGGDYIDEFSFIIYNRLGQVVFSGNSLEDEWDGTYKGEVCPWGVYGWTVQYKSNYRGLGKTGEKRGFVTIVR